METFGFTYIGVTEFRYVAVRGSEVISIPVRVYVETMERYEGDAKDFESQRPV